jgi:ACS family hexuronate transporter-like MFS transporter
MTTRVRWRIGALLFLSTTINYIDRQSLSALAPFLKAENHWTNEQFALVIIGFRAAYAIGQALAGRFLDKVGTRDGLSLAVLWYSVAAMLTPLATGLRSLCGFRFLLGLGEAANWPGATKAVSEWFPRRERGLAVALFDSGSAIGGAVAPVLVVWLYHTFGSWRPAFAVPGMLGLIWLALWRATYRRPEDHPHISESERRMILEDRGRDRLEMPKARWIDVVRMRETWGIVIGKALTDPVWFFVTDWFAVYLVSKKISIEEGVLAFWIPFLAADAGNFLGGGVSSWLVRRGWPVVKARKAVIVVGGIGMTLLVPAVWTSNVFALAALFGVSTLSYAAWSTMGLTLPSDVYPNHWVATVSGLSGAGAGVGTIISTYLIGWTADRYSFEPILVVASLVPLVATAAVLGLVREPGSRQPQSS